MRRSLLTCSLAFILLGIATHASAKSRAVPPTVTCDDLISIVFPERAEDPATGTTVHGPTAVAPRRLMDDDAGDIVEGVTEIGACVALTVPDGPDTRYVLFIEIAGELVNDFTPFVGHGALVAVIDAGPSHRLLDLVEVQQDRECDFQWGGPTSRIGRRAHSFVVTNTHHNSQQYYHSYDVLYVHQGRIRQAASVRLLSWKTSEVEVDESLTFRLVPRRGSPLRDVVVTVKVNRRPYQIAGEAPRGRRSSRTYRGIYRWHGESLGYRAAGGTLDRVDVLNARNY